MTEGQGPLFDFSLEVSVDGHLERISVQSSQNGLRVLLDNQWLDMDVAKISGSVYSLIFNGQSHHAVINVGEHTLDIMADGIPFRAMVVDPKQFRGDSSSGPNRTAPSSVLAPMPGKIVKVLVAAGDSVREGQGVVVIEAMKMQNELKATKSGLVGEVKVAENQAVNAGDCLVVLQ